MKDHHTRLLRGSCLALAALGALIGAPGSGRAVENSDSPSHSSPKQTSQAVFQSPERAVEALIGANRDDSLESLRRILGPAGDELIQSGDPVADRHARSRFVAAYDASHRIEIDGPDKAVLVVGVEEWPLPIPLIRERSGWRFDTQAGAREILDRRIGRNELSVIEVCREYVKAQREYAATNGISPHAADTQTTGATQLASVRKPEYAQRIASHDGQHDGLYWHALDGENDSPLGPLLAQAGTSSEEKPGQSIRTSPYHGYLFHVLTRQGPHASGGARSYIVNGRMTEGFGLLAYPATYDNSGIMTFIVNQNGIVYEKNLGPQTGQLASAIDEYDPDASWHTP
jgi:Protein of unknown function (DUF2950)